MHDGPLDMKHWVRDFSLTLEQRRWPRQAAGDTLRLRERPELRVVLRDRDQQRRWRLLVTVCSGVADGSVTSEEEEERRKRRRCEESESKRRALGRLNHKS